MAECNKRIKITELMPILICALSIPISLFLWLGNVAFTKISFSGEKDPIPLTRWFISILIPILLMVYGLKRKGVSKSGAFLGLIIAIILSISSHSFLASLAAFFFTSSRATKFRSEKKKVFEEGFKEGGQRTWTQVLCNAGFAGQLSLLYLLDCGSGERPIDFGTLYRSSWLGIGIMSSFACCNGDTWASEIGSVIGSTDPFLITTRKCVPRGTNGGVTVIGLIVSFLGGIVIGLAYYFTVIYTVDTMILAQSPSQWPIILFGGFAGLLGSIIDSILGATLQYSGQNEKGQIVERPGKNIRHISGYSILDNHSVNLISSILTGLVVPIIALKCWP